MSAPAPLSVRTMAAYGLPNIALSVVHLPLAIYLPAFYSQNLGLSLAAVGLVIFLSRLTDVVTDPLVGAISDRWKSPLGRRKNWIIFGIPLMVVSLWLLYVPPGEVSIWWLLGFVCLVYLANTFIDLPYKAWGAELSTSYAERSRVTGWREAMGIVGVIVALIIPVAAQNLGFGGTPNAVWSIAVATAILLPLLFLPALFTVPEPDVERVQRTQKISWLRGLRIIWRNGPFLRLAVMGLILLATVNMTASLSILFVSHVIGTPDRFAFFVLCYYLATFAAVPVWVKIADRFGKHRTVAIAIVWLSIWSAPLPLLSTGDFWLFFFFMIMKGSAIGALFFLPPSMAADVIDLDTLRSGEQRTGLYFAIWGMVLKGAVALGVLTATTGSEFFGFDPRCASTPEQIAAAAEGTCVNDPFALLMLACLYSVIPAVIALLTIPWMWSYPITEARQQKLRAAIARRNAALKPALGSASDLA